MTDAVVSVPEDPPEINTFNDQNSFPLLFHSRDKNGDVRIENEETLREGWQKICLFALYFRPSALDILGTFQSFYEALMSPDRSKKNFYGLFPWRYVAGIKSNLIAFTEG